MSSYLPLCFVLGLLLIIVWHRHHATTGSDSIHLPPGPRGDPLLGHLRSSPLKQHFSLFTEWAKRYGTLRLNLSASYMV